jgi:hypothetical protein
LHPYPQSAIALPDLAGENMLVPLIDIPQGHLGAVVTFSK